MRLAGIVAVACVAVVVAGCSLGLGGLGDMPGADGGEPEVGVDAAANGDVTVGDDSSSPGEASATDATEGGSAEGDAPGEASVVDSPPPPPPDAGCKGVVCNGSCSGMPDCSGCSGANLLCPMTKICTSDCTACQGAPIECFACDMTRMNPIGTCQRQDVGSYCLDENYAGAYQGGQGYHCACNTADDCPGDDQVCIGIGSTAPPFGCFTCGEAFTDMATCKAGKGNAMCNEMKASCN